MGDTISGCGRWGLLMILILGAVSDCREPVDPVEREPWTWDLPAGFPTPRVPADNQISVEKVELGRHLFYDRRLSGNQQFSCASCHLQELAFTDGRGRSVGATGEDHLRGAMSLANVAYNRSLNWADPETESLEEQALVPLFGEHPVELGLSREDLSWMERFREESLYQELFGRAFPEKEDPFQVEMIVKALASFQRTLISGNSPFDRFLHQGDSEAMSPSAQRGMALFFSERLECFHCHGGFNFSDDVDHEGLVFNDPSFHNTGLYNYDHRGSYPPGNQGIYEFTGNPEDMGRFRAPTLRNIEVTGPYMHDGSVETLEEVIDHYGAGGRRIHEGPWAGNGAENPFKSPFVVGFQLSEAEREDLLAFLKSLTDEEFLTNPAFSDPWQ